MGYIVIDCTKCIYYADCSWSAISDKNQTETCKHYIEKEKNNVK